MRWRFALGLGMRLLRGRAGTARYFRGAVLGIGLSLVPLIVVMEVSSGMIDGITARLIEIGTYHLRIPLPASTTPRALDAETSAVMASGAAVQAVPERQGLALLFFRGRSAGVTVRFVPDGVFQTDPGLRSFVTAKSGTTSLADAHAVLVGAALAQTLGVTAGDGIVALTPYGADGSGPPKITPLVVGGVFQTGYQELEKLYAFVSLDASWSMLSENASSTLIGVRVPDPFADLSNAVQKIRQKLPQATRIYTWRELEYARLQSFQFTKALLVFIMALIVLVAGVNVSSSVIMIAFERRMEMGILKSVGAAPGSLSFAFVLAGVATGLLGTVAGVAMGLLAAVNINQIIQALQWVVNAVLGAYAAVRATIVPGSGSVEPVTIFNSAYYLSSIPIRIQWTDVFWAAAGTIALSGIASYFPAARAARERPLEVIRKV